MIVSQMGYVERGDSFLREKKWLLMWWGGGEGGRERKPSKAFNAPPIPKVFKACFLLHPCQHTLTNTLAHPTYVTTSLPLPLQRSLCRFHSRGVINACGHWVSISQTRCLSLSLTARQFQALLALQSCLLAPTHLLHPPPVTPCSARCKGEGRVKCRFNASSQSCSRWSRWWRYKFSS